MIRRTLFPAQVDRCAFRSPSIGLFSFFIACLYAVRLQPINKFAGILPAFAALIGALS